VFDFFRTSGGPTRVKMLAYYCVVIVEAVGVLLAWSFVEVRKKRR